MRLGSHKLKEPIARANHFDERQVENYVGSHDQKRAYGEHRREKDIVVYEVFLLFVMRVVEPDNPYFETNHNPEESHEPDLYEGLCVADHDFGCILRILEQSVRLVPLEK